MYQCFIRIGMENTSFVKMRGIKFLPNKNNLQISYHISFLNSVNQVAKNKFNFLPKISSLRWFTTRFFINSSHHKIKHFP
jgi:hypothetical protein